MPSDFYIFLLKKFLSVQRQRFQNDREAEIRVTVVPIPGGRLWYCREIGKFVIVLMMYYDITEREKGRFDMGMC